MPHRSQRDFEDEIRSHLALEADRLIEEGMSPDEAQHAARRRFGNVTRAQERHHRTSRWVWAEQIAQDVRYAARMLRKSPLFSSIAILTVALGIGANTAVFSIVNGVLLSPLPYREPERLVKIWETLPGLSEATVSYPDYKDWQERARVFNGVAVYSPYSNRTLTGGDVPERVGVGLASANLFDVLGVATVIGRAFRPEDDRPGVARVVMLASGFWQQRQGGDARVLGSTLTLDGEPYTVIGVLPPMVGLGSVDLWVPVGLSANDPSFSRPNHPGLIGVGRLQRGVTVGQMNQDLARIAREIAAEHPTESAGIGAAGDSFRELLVHNIRPALSLLTWSVLCVLLIACVNVANLLLARSTSRRKEIALRLALGASHGRIRRLMLSEHLLVSALGGVLGVGLAYGAVRAVVQTRPAGVPRLADIHIDLTVLGFAAAVSLLTGIVFGLLPARSATRVDLIDPLKESGRSSVSSATLRLRGMLMTGEVALALMLLIGAGLLIRSVSHLAQVNPGVDPRGITTGFVFLPESKYPDADRQRIALQQILQRIQTVPGVTSAALTSAFPLASNAQVGVTFEGHPKPMGQQPLVNIQLISRDYFNTVRMRVVRGNGFLGSNPKGDDDAVWIDETIAKKYFPGEDPVGRRIVRGPFDSKEQAWVVAGVVNDVLDQGLDERARGTLYRPFEPEPQSWMGVVIKTSMPFEQVLPAVRRGIAAVDPALPLANEETLEHIITQSIGQETFTMYVLVGFAVVALILAAVGVYGVIAYFVAQRAREIGIRMALGAQRSDIVSLVSSRVMVTAGAGVVVGLAGAAAASGLMSTLVYEVAPIDAATYATGALALLAVAALAAVVPTLRATRVNPASAMRAD